MLKYILCLLYIFTCSSSWGSLYLRVKGTEERGPLKKDQIIVQTKGVTVVIAPSKIKSPGTLKALNGLVGGKRVDVNIIPSAVTHIKVAQSGGR